MSRERRFPIEKLRLPKERPRLSGGLVLNRNLGPKWTPRLRFRTGFAWNWGTKLETWLAPGDVVIQERDWRCWDGVRGEEHDGGGSCITVSDQHCPVVTHAFRIRRKEGLVFRIEWEVELLLEGTGWQNARTTLDLEVEYAGVVVAELLEQKLPYPRTWGVRVRGGRFDERGMRGLLSRFVELDGYHLEVEERGATRTWRLHPVL